MTTAAQRTNRKLSLLQLFMELGDVSKACQIMNYHRDTFCEVQKAFKTGGVAALVEARREPKNPHPNRISEAVEQQILDLYLKRPIYGCQRIANELRLQGADVKPSGVRGAWLRHDPATRYKRLMRLEAEAHEHTHVLTEEQILQLERHSPESRMRHVEAEAPGNLLNQDTFYWSTLKDVGRIPAQLVMDAFCSLAFPKVYTSKTPVTAADLPYDQVQPFYVALAIAANAVPADNAREISGNPEQHPNDLLLTLHDIEYRTTKAHSPRTSRLNERPNRTLFDEHIRNKPREVIWGRRGDPGRPGRPSRIPQPRAQPSGLSPQGAYACSRPPRGNRSEKAAANDPEPPSRPLRYRGLRRSARDFNGA